MITSKHMPKIVAILVGICLLACGFIVCAANTFDTTYITEYQRKLFGDEVIVLDIQVNESEWQDMINNAQAKEWISADIMINGERFSTVGIRTKGNSSLSAGGGMRGGGSTNNYSLQFKMNKYTKGQTYYGLDTFCVNNMMGDTTYMKDYLSYDIMRYIGVDAPLTNYANVTVNGADYGFGVAIERYDKAFLDRVYRTSAGQLYNVKIQRGQRGNFEDMRQEGIFDEMPNRQQDGAFGNRQPGVGMGGFGGGSGGGSLVYIDDDISSYSSIFENATFNSTSDQDKQRVIEALKNLNAGTDLEKYLDVDGILRYLAAHTVVVNLDSYTSNMQQNYYIYERDGKITILPWDYGLAFGGFQSGNASSIVNFPIDTPVSGVSMEDRPLISVLLQVDEYRDKYHEYLRQIVEGYFESGLYEGTILALDEKINEFVKDDVSAFSTHEQYQDSLPQLIELGRLRAESIKGQLDGTIPSTSSGQNADSTALINASTVNLSALGSMMGGGNRQEWQGDFTGEQNGQSEMPPMLDGRYGGGQPEDQGRQSGERQPEGQEGVPPDRDFGMPNGMIDRALMQQAMQIMAEAGGELTEEVRTALLELGLTEEQIEMFSMMAGEFSGGDMRNGEFPDRGGQNAFPGGDNNERQNGMPDRNANFPQDISNTGGTAGQNERDGGYAVTVILLMVILAGAIIFVAAPRKNAI